MMAQLIIYHLQALISFTTTPVFRIPCPPLNTIENMFQYQDYTLATLLTGYLGGADSLVPCVLFDRRWKQRLPCCAMLKDVD